VEKKRDKITKINSLPSNDKEDLRYLIRVLTEFKDKETISEGSVRELDNVINQLITMRSKHVFSLMSWLKQEYVFDD
tara:strand:+ start:265 stop:495 length:231 start_codon:yes stop_codon:yes gene_type:complete